MSKKLQTKREKYNKMILYCWRNIRPSGSYITWNNEDMSTGKRNLSSICILRKFTFSTFFSFAITTAAWRNIREDFRTHTHTSSFQMRADDPSSFTFLNQTLEKSNYLNYSFILQYQERIASDLWLLHSHFKLM